MSRLLPADEFDLLIFGGAGDLAMRKLLPALYHRARDRQIVGNSRIIAVGRRNLTRDAYIDQAGRALRAYLAADDFCEEQWRRFRKRILYVQADAMLPDSWSRLGASLPQTGDRTRVAYLATAPDLYGPIARGLRECGLITRDSRIVLEKPLGRDFASACEINNAVGECFPENRIYRIDHYLGKETVQNLLALRFGNFLFEPLWRRGFIDHVQITVAEDIGVGDRLEFYDRIGALRDMVQNHLLQLVCLIAMEAPSSLHQEAVRDEKVKVLRALKPIPGSAVRQQSVRGQYVAGAIGGRPVKGYAEELGGRESGTETFAALKIEIENWRWSQVPFYLRTGKRMPRKISEIVVQFHEVPHSIFPEQQYDVLPNRLLIRLQPNEGMQMAVMAKKPGPGGFHLRPVSLDLSFEEAFGVRYPDAYERLLMEVLRGNTSLFMRRDEVELAWAWIDGIIADWRQTRQRIESYVAGSWGPSGSSTLLDRDGRVWHPDGLGSHAASFPYA